MKPVKHVWLICVFAALTVQLLGQTLTNPKALTATAGNAQVALNWQGATGAASYNIYRGLASNGEDTIPLANVAAITFVDPGTINGTKYFYRVAAVDSAGAVSAASNEASATPQPPPPASAPDGLAATPGNAQITLIWTAVTDATGYRVYRDTTSGGAFATLVGSSTGPTFKNTGLTNGAEYFYKVRAFNGGGNGPMSGAAGATAIATPTGLTATRGDTQIALNWQAAAGAETYNVTRRTASTVGDPPVVATGLTAPTFTDTELTNGVRYYYRVRGINPSGTSAVSAEVSAIPQPPPPASAPEGLTAVPGNARIALKWTAVTGATGYRIYRETTAGGAFATQLVSVTGTAYINSGLTNGDPYFYKVLAYNGGGNGPLSDSVNATPLATPTSLTGTRGDTQVTLNWQAAAGAESYNVYRRTASTVGDAPAIATGVTPATFLDTELTNGVQYFYRVRGVNPTGTSAASNEVSVTPQPPPPAAPPEGLTAAPGNAQVVLNWSAVSDATGYRIFRSTEADTPATTPLVNVTGTTYRNGGLTNGVTYFYKVLAFNPGGPGPLSIEVSATPLAPPLAPGDVTATAGNGWVSVNWTPVPTAGSYSVYRGTQSNHEASTAVATGVAGPPFLDNGIANGPIYYYKVTALNVGGESPRSAEVNANPEAPQPPPDPATISAFRLLRQATWGARPGDVEYVKSIGEAAFLSDQFAMPPSVYPDALFDMPVEETQERMLHNALTQPDQLRQRVAWALHKIWVVSAVEVNNSSAIVDYERILLNGAFGNYRDLMRDVTLNPAMGRYLNMLNSRSQAVTGVLPNENFPRELMQLFTVGIPTLSPSGIPVLDGDGKQIPVYTEADVKELARIFTGWTFGDGEPTTIPTRAGPETFKAPMEAVERFHDTGSKTFLGVFFPPGQTARQDLDRALDVLFNHPNMGPFIARQLILQLVTSNPSPGYVRDVAAVFDDNGAGVRGDLTAVVAALLTHPEARTPTSISGKLMEPALFVTSQLRGLNAVVADNSFIVSRTPDMGQNIFYPPSVFSYFSPGYRVRGTSLGGPEFQILTTVSALARTNFVGSLLAGRYGASVAIDYTPFTTLATDPDALVDYCSLLFMGGQMSLDERTEIISAVRVSPETRLIERVRTAIYLTLTVAQFQVDR